MPNLGCSKRCAGSTMGMDASLRPAFWAMGWLRLIRPLMAAFQRAEVVTSCSMGPGCRKKGSGDGALVGVGRLAGVVAAGAVGSFSAAIVVGAAGVVFCSSLWFGLLQA